MAESDLTDLFPLAAETPESIMARMLADVNAGIDPSDPAYADIVPGSFWADVSGAYSLETDRVYDRMFTEVPAAALPGTSTGQWLDQWADSVGLQRKPATTSAGIETFMGANGTPVPTGTQVSTESPTPDADPITFQTTQDGVIDVTGSIDLPIECLDAGSVGNVPANAVTLLDSSIDGVTVTNAAAITSGSDVETDESLSGRVLKKLRGVNGAGNVDYYENLALNYPGVGFVTVQANTPSLGHVTVMISDVDRAPAAGTIIDGLQALLDPSSTPAQGAGQATIGATVIVDTPSALIVALVASGIVCEDGYSVDGSGGTKSVAPDMLTAVSRYFTTLGTGDDVIHNQVLGAMVKVEGVVDVPVLTLNTLSGNVAVDATHVAELQVPLTLS